MKGRKTRKIICDVLVVGGGVSGVAAAAAAARAGADAVLVERENYLGGEVTAGMHLYLCGLYAGNTRQTINGGIARELVKKLGRNAAPVKMGRVNVLRFDQGDFKRAVKNIARHKNLKVYKNCRATGVRTLRGRVVAVQAGCKNFSLLIKPAAVVDASGFLVRRIKAAAYNDKGKRHLGGYCFKIAANCRDALLGVKIAYALDKAVKAGILPWYCRLTQTTIVNDRSALIKMSLPFDQAHLKRAHADSERLLKHLKQNIPELKSARIIRRGVLLERSGPRCAAVRILTQHDVLSGRKHLAGAARGAWPVEFWGSKGIEYGYVQNNYYDIPSDCLRAKNIANLFAAGRFIGADAMALASARAAGICLATGQAAGKLAAGCARRKK